MIPLIPLKPLKHLKMPELPNCKPAHNYLLRFHDPGRADFYLTVWANSPDEATAMALQIEASTGCPFAYDCLELSGSHAHENN